MSTTFTRDPYRELTVVTISGEVTLSDLVDLRAALRVDTTIDRREGILTDLTGVTRFAVSTEELQSLARATDARDSGVPDSRVAVVADSDVAFGLARMYQQTLGRPPSAFTVCRTFEEAYAWLAG